MRETEVQIGNSGSQDYKGRSSIPFEKLIDLDLQYVRKGLWLDLKILAKTNAAVLKGSGAA